MWLDRLAAWSPGVVSGDWVVRDFSGPVGQWSYLLAPKSLREKSLLNSYSRCGTLTATMAAEGIFAEGDRDRDGFDESQGCYFLQARTGHCRFRILPPKTGLLDAIFRIGGPWESPVSVNSQGMAIRNVVHLADGSVLFVIPGWIRHAVDVEVTGRIGVSRQSEVLEL